MKYYIYKTPVQLVLNTEKISLKNASIIIFFILQNECQHVIKPIFLLYILKKIRRLNILTLKFT